MSSVSSITSATSPYASAADAATSTATATTTTGTKTLGQSDFLKLLSVQFQNQDPMKPMDDTAFIAQMAQFSSLEQTQTLTQQMTQMRATQDLTTANSYIGRQVTVNDGNGGTVTGNVTAVDASGSSPQLIVNNQSYALSAVLRLEPGATTGNSASTN